jgi:hypothetical protein
LVRRSVVQAIQANAQKGAVPEVLKLGTRRVTPPRPPKPKKAKKAQEDPSGGEPIAESSGGGQ